MRFRRFQLPPHDEIAIAVADHLVIPAAVIAMTSAVFAYLLDVRSAIWTGNEVLKWIGFCFAAATVLIARYEKRTGEDVLRNLYTIFLGFAVVIAILDRSNSWTEGFASVAIVWFVWWFATRLTERLTWMDGPPTARLPALWEVMLYPPGELPQTTAVGGGSRSSERSSSGTNAVVATVRFAAVAIIIFALGEPILVSGPPEAAQWALVSVIVFFLAGGIVAASAATVERLRAAKSSGGEASMGVLPTRILWAAGTISAVLALALLTPGLTTVGTATRLPHLDPDTVVVDGSVAPELRAVPDGLPADRAPGFDPAPKSPGFTDGGPSTIRAGGPPIPWAGLLAPFLGPVSALISLTVIVYVLVQLREFAQGWARGAGARAKSAWKRLLEAGWLRVGSMGSGSAGEPFDPGAELLRLMELAPRQAVLEAYASFRTQLRLLGWHVRPQATPFELVSDLAGQKGRVVRALDTLTELYVAAAYAGTEMTPVERSEALDALRSLQELPGNP